MRRVILIVMDGCGIGAMPDASSYSHSDVRSATLPNVASAVGGLHLPVLGSLGLGNIARIRGVPPCYARGGWGKMAEMSPGKDSLTGHWEMMGIVSRHPFPTYPKGFPPDLIERIEKRIGREIIGNKPASGTEIIRELGDEHVRTGKPIVYTSADSVLQIASHEDVISVDDQHRMADAVRRLLQPPHNVQRVIARPFIGDSPETYRRTENRGDFPLAPPPGHLLQRMQGIGLGTHGIGVVSELFPAQYFVRIERTRSNNAHLEAIRTAVEEGTQSLIFANCEDFDMLYGHRNDPEGFAAALCVFDAVLRQILLALRPDDLLLITADHGNDPTIGFTDHTREYVPILMAGSVIPEELDLGTRATFADVAATIAEWLGVSWDGPGQSCLA